MQSDVMRRSTFHATAPKTHYEANIHIGVTLTKALCAYSAGDYMQCITLLEPLHLKLQSIGGSHAQRDVIPQTLFAAIQKLHQRLRTERDAYRSRGNWARTDPFYPIKKTHVYAQIFPEGDRLIKKKLELSAENFQKKNTVQDQNICLLYWLVR